MHRFPHRSYLFVLSFLVGISLPIVLFWAMTPLHLSPFQKTEIVTEKYLEEEEVFVILPRNDQEEPIIIPIEKVLFEYVEVFDGCGPHFEGECVNVRSGPGEDFSVVTKLRNGVVLKVGGKVEHGGRAWYKIVFNETIRYPKRVAGDWYVAADYVHALLDEGDRGLEHALSASSTKRIVVKRGKPEFNNQLQHLY